MYMNYILLTEINDYYLQTRYVNGNMELNSCCELQPGS